MKTQIHEITLKNNTSRAAIIGVIALIAATSSVFADAEKLFSVGDNRFGADGQYTFKDRVTNDFYEGTFNAVANGYVLGKRLTIGSGESYISVKRPSQCTATGNLKIAGATLARWNRSFNGSTTWSTPPFIQWQAGGEARFSIGPASLKLKAGAEMKVYARGAAEVRWSPTSRQPIIKAEAGPALDAAATGTAELDAIIASAGLEAKLQITGYGLTGKLEYMPRQNGNPTVSYAITADTVSTDGTIKGWIKIGRGWLSKKWNKTFAEYHAGSSSAVIAQGRRQL